MGEGVSVFVFSAVLSSVMECFVFFCFAQSRMEPSSDGASPAPVDASQESDGSEQDDPSPDSQLHHPHPHPHEQQEQREHQAKRPGTSHPAVMKKDSPMDGAVLSVEVATAKHSEDSPELAANVETASPVQTELHQAEDSPCHPDSTASLPPPKPRPLVKPKPAVSKPKVPSPSSPSHSSTQKTHPAAPVMKDPSMSPAVAEGVAIGTEQDQLLASLLHQAGENDYYGLLGAAPSAEESELARCRRERNQELHPDHFVNDPEGRRRLVTSLVEICVVPFCSLAHRVLILTLLYLFPQLLVCTVLASLLLSIHMLCSQFFLPICSD